MTTISRGGEMQLREVPSQYHYKTKTQLIVCDTIEELKPSRVFITHTHSGVVRAVLFVYSMCQRTIGQKSVLSFHPVYFWNKT